MTGHSDLSSDWDLAVETGTIEVEIWNGSSWSKTSLGTIRPFNDSAADDYVMVWNGSSWDTESTLTLPNQTTQNALVGSFNGSCVMSA